jgi:hypothetical protein
MQQPCTTPANAAALFLRRPTTTWKPSLGSWSNSKPMQCISGSPRGSGRQNRKWPPVGVVVVSTTCCLFESWMACRKSAGHRAGPSLIESMISFTSSPHDQHHPFGFTAPRMADQTGVAESNINQSTRAPPEREGTTCANTHTPAPMHVRTDPAMHASTHAATAAATASGSPRCRQHALARVSTARNPKAVWNGHHDAPHAVFRAGLGLLLARRCERIAFHGRGHRATGAAHRRGGRMERLIPVRRVLAQLKDRRHCSPCLCRLL